MADKISVKIVGGPELGRNFEITCGESLLVGRGEASDTRINDPSMSRTHFRIFFKEGEVAVNDEGSSSGTFQNGHRISSAIAKLGDVIQAGDTMFKVNQAEDESEKTVAPDTINENSKANIGNLVGKIMGGYKIESVIRKGTNSVIFKAHDMENDRPAAVKVMLPQFIKDEQHRDRFIRAMKTMLTVKHLHIIELFSAGKAGGLCYAGMEYIEGEDLATLIDRMGVDGILDWQEVWRCAVHITRALHIGYDRQIIHRNVIPTNIIRRTHDKLFKLGDFMLAKALEGSLAKQITQPGQLLGDVHYMPPERTQDDAEVDTRSDIYGLGATCYALLTGRPPAEGQNLIEVLTNVRNQKPEPVSKYQLYVNPVFESIVMKMIEKDPADRYATPRDLLLDLEQVGKSERLETDTSDWWVG